MWLHALKSQISISRGALDSALGLWGPAKAVATMGGSTGGQLAADTAAWTAVAGLKQINKLCLMHPWSNVSNVVALQITHF